VSPGTDEARKMTAISGLKYEPLLKQSDPIGAFSKTFMVTSAWVSTRCYLTWKVVLTPHKRSVYQLAPSMPRTAETASSWWPTPKGVDYKGARKPETMEKTGRNPMTNSLGDAVAHTNPVKEGQLSGSLNPKWVEWLMGYPEGWTELED
tara:strand:+ start:1105 stop:1551 length:447 start_codon:yes stop_codon:yes gene_type:complete